MQAKNIFLLGIGFVLQFFIFSSAVARIQSTYGDFDYSFLSVFKPESFFGNNITWLNNANRDDKSFFARHTLDMMLDVIYGMQTYGVKTGQFYFQLRNKGIWGKSETVASTTTTPIKLGESLVGPHQHSIPRHIFWMRQGWLQFTINEFASLPFQNIHVFTCGAFPFQLGRGIALGDAYAVGPEALGFYADSVVDQYAFGGKFAGELLPTVLTYDFYSAILSNNSSGLSDTSKKILGQEFGRLKKPERGFGKINFLLAARLNWNVFDDEFGRLMLEPYALYNHDPEQTIEFSADATSKLGTIGWAGEYYGDRFEIGFDCAINLGYQQVKGWDRNEIETVNRQAQLVQRNAQVTTEVNGITERVPYVNGSEAQNIINNAFRDESQNGQVIGEVDSVGYLTAPPGEKLVLKNSQQRFRNPYKNMYNGWMLVADASYSSKNKNFSVAATVGVASGDDNPNFDRRDGTYDGFISLQEIYSGKRVRSVFLFGGAGKVKRFLSSPTPEKSPDPFARAISGFTNIVITGAAVSYKPSNWKKRFEINPNVISFWQEKPIGNARTYLGTEWGTFINYNVFKDMKLFVVTSVFFPGSHYADRKGIPVETARQIRDSDDLDVTGFTQDRIAQLGDNVAYTFNMGLIYSF